MANDTETGSERRRLKRLYKLRDGTVVGASDLSDQVAGVVWETISGGLRVECNLADLFKDGNLPEPSMGLCAAAFGMNTVVGNAIAGKTGSAEDLVRMLGARLGQIVEDKEWSEGRLGPRLGDIIEAWALDAIERGMPVDDEKRKLVETKLRAKEWTREGLLENPGIKAQYDALEVKKAMEKLEKSKAALQASKQGDSAATTFDL